MSDSQKKKRDWKNKGRIFPFPLFSWSRRLSLVGADHKIVVVYKSGLGADLYNLSTQRFEASSGVVSYGLS